MTALVPCPVCKARVGLRPDVTMKRHMGVFSHRNVQCPGTGASPACGFCQRPAKHPTLAANVFVCDDCHAAVQRRDRVRRCEAKGCKGGRVRCDEHMATAEERDDGLCGNCGGRERASATEEQEERAAVLHDTAVSADVPMILVSSMTKDAQRAQGREGKAATTADFRGAGLDYATDVMVFLTIPENADLGDGRRTVRFEVTKNRYGETGILSLVFDRRRGRFLPDVHRTEGAMQPWREDAGSASDEGDSEAVPYGRPHWQDGAYTPGGDAE